MTNNTALYLDGGNPEETKTVNEVLKSGGFVGLDGQTTNPTLIAKNLSEKLGGKKVSMEEAVAEYRRIVEGMRQVIEGPISIQVLGNPETLTTEDMLSQARDRITWIPNAVIKFPCTVVGLKAIEEFCKEGPVNVTLVFSQAQAAAVYAATKYRNHPIYVSPFVGRLDDKQENGMDVIANIVQMYKGLGDGHVQVLTASTRTVKHVQYALKLGSDVITIPSKLYMEWKETGFALPQEDFVYDVPGLTEIPYQELNLDNEWTSFDVHHELTDSGIQRFWSDWSAVVE
jgi:transaldolase